jgi:hypothetical protein
VPPVRGVCIASAANSRHSLATPVSPQIFVLINGAYATLTELRDSRRATTSITGRMRARRFNQTKRLVCGLAPSVRMCVGARCAVHLRQPRGAEQAMPRILTKAAASVGGVAEIKNSATQCVQIGWRAAVGVQRSTLAPAPVPAFTKMVLCELYGSQPTCDDHWRAVRGYNEQTASTMTHDQFNGKFLQRSPDPQSGKAHRSSGEVGCPDFTTNRQNLGWGKSYGPDMEGTV